MKLRKKTYVYSIQITKVQRDMLKKNDDVKKDLDKVVRDYLNHFVIENEE